MKECWKDIPEWEGHYQASNLGHIRSVDRKIYKPNRWGGVTIQTLRGKVLSLKCHQKYARVALSKGGIISYHTVHRLIALTWLGKCPKGLQVLHGNFGHTDNSSSNLRYGTPSCNSQERADLDKLYGTAHNQPRRRSVRRNDGRVFKTMADAARSVGCDRSSISYCCSGQLKSVKGFSWELVL